MKKQPFILIVLTLIVATLACNLPHQNPAVDIPVITNPEDGYRVESSTTADAVISIAVPDAYYVGDSVAGLSSIVEDMLQTDVPVEVDLSGLLGVGQTDILLWGYDAGSAAEVPTSFVVIKNQEYGLMPLGLISTLAGTLLGDAVEIVQEQRLTIAGRDSLRWITITREAGFEFTQAVYIFKDSGVLYLIVFNADQQEVYAQLPTYDSIVASLRIEDL